MYGSHKRETAYNYAGQRCARPHPAIWAESGWVLAADLGSGRTDPRPQAASLIKRSVAALPEGLGRPIIRMDSGFFSREVAEAALANGADFAICAKRSSAAWSAERRIPDGDWREAAGMDAEVAECDYVPTRWPPGTRTIARRVKLAPDEVSSDIRSRRRRTIDPNQLALLVAGQTQVVYAYSFIVTNLDGDIVDIESWFRMRALVEERIKDSKLGLALRHLPSGYDSVNRAWMWGALLGLNCSAWLQAITGHDDKHRAHGKRLRRELIGVAARVTNHAHRIEVHVSPADDTGAFGRAWRRLDLMLATANP